MEEAAIQRIKIDSAVIVGHAHHVARVALILAEHNITPVIPVESYIEYDPMEAQERVVSEHTFIVSECVSVASHPPWKRSFS